MARDLFQEAGVSVAGTGRDLFAEAGIDVSPGKKRRPLDEIIKEESDPIRAANKAQDAGYDYVDVDKAISSRADVERAASEKRTVANVATDLVAQPLVGVQKMAAGAIRGVGDIIAPEPDKPIDAMRERGGVANVRQIIGRGLSEFGGEVWNEGKGVEKQVNVDMPNSTTQGLYSGAKSLAMQAPMLAAPGVAAPLVFMGSQVGLDKYGEAREAKYSPGTSAAIGAGHGGIEVATEWLPTKFFKDAVGKTGIKEFITGLLLRELPGEQAATLGQDAIDQAAGLSGKSKGDWEQYWRERPDAAYQTLLATLSQSGLQTGGHAAYKKLLEINNKDSAKAQQQNPTGQPGITPEAPASPSPAVPTVTANEISQHTADRLAEIERKATGSKEQTIPGPDGKPVVIPGEQPQFLTPEEKAERDFLTKNQSNPEALAAGYGVQIADEQQPAQDPFERLVTLELIAEQRQLTPDEIAEQHRLQSEIDNGAPGESVQSESIAQSSGMAENVPAASQAPNVTSNDLQNRDRSQIASVDQMQSIARNPDYMRLGPSRTPDSGAPMVFAVGNDLSAIPNTNMGREDIAVMADGQRVPFRYAVVNANTVNPSNFADGATNPEFESADQGTLKALNNGRTAGLRAAHGAGNGQSYTAELIADAGTHGVSVDAIRSTPNPMLVRVYSEDSNTDGMAAKSQGQGLGMSPSELARQDAPLIDSSALSVYEPGDVASVGNRDFVRSFMGNLQSTGQDIAPLITSDGQLSQAGRQRIQAALMQSAYGDADLVQEMFDSLDTDIKAIGEALKSVAGSWAGMREAARIGAINPETDITGNLIQAVRMIQRARRDKMSIYDMINQRDLMTGETPDEATVSVLRMFYTGNYLTRATGKDRLIESLSKYLTGAMQTQAGAGLFGDTVSAKDILNSITQGDQSESGNQAEESGRESGGRSATRGGSDRPGSQTQRPVADSTGRKNDENGREAPAQTEPEASNKESGQGVRPEELELTGQTNAQASAEFKRQQEEATKKDESQASPTVTADQVDLFNTQDSLFNSNRDAAPATKEKPLVDTVGPNGSSANADSLIPRDSSGNSSVANQPIEDKRAEAKETDKGIAMFSRGSGEGMALRDLQAVVDRISKSLNNLPKVHVLASPSELSKKDPSQKSLRDYIRKAGAWEDAEGATHDGEIYLFASGLADEARAEHVLATHEVTHYGLRGAIGKDLDGALQEVWMLNAKVRKAAAELKERYGLKSNIEATEEVLADMRPQDLVKLMGWRRVVKSIRDWLGRSGFNKLAAQFDSWLKSGLDDVQKADLMVADLVNAARDWVKNGKGRPFMDGTRLADGSLAEDVAAQEKWLTREAKGRGYKSIDDMAEKNYKAFENLAKLWREKHPVDGALLSRNVAVDQTKTPEFKKWFGDSKVVDESGKPIVVYHGTGATDISEFKVSKGGTYGGGIYLTPEMRGANDYAIYRGAPSSTVYPVYATIKNPASGAEAAQVASWMGEENARDELIKRGYDGVIDMRNGEIVAFYPEQIKSAIGNNGQFDGANPDIRMSRGNSQIANQSIDQQQAELRIQSLLGDKLGKALIDSGVVTFTNKGKEYQGATFADGSIALNLDSLTAENFDGVLQHEGFHSTIKQLVGEETYQQIIGKLGVMRKLGNGADWFKSALSAVPEGTVAADINEEIGAYAVEQYVNGEKQPNVIRNWVKSLLSALRAAIIQRMPAGKLKNWAIANITGQDMARLAIAGLRAKAAGVMQEQRNANLAYSKQSNLESKNNQTDTPDIRYSKAHDLRDAAKAKVDELTSPDAINTLIYNFQNKYIDLKNIKDRIIKMGGQITDLNDAYLGEETYHSKVMKRGKDFLESEMKPLLQQLHNNQIKKEDFEQFLHARHAPERNAEMAKRNPNQAMIDAGKTQADADVKALELQLQTATAQGLATKAIDSALTKARAEKTKWHGAQAFQGTEEERNSLSGMSDAAAAQVIASIPAGRRSTMNSAAAKVDAINAKTLDTQLAAGLIDQATFDAIKKAYQYYVPLHRDEAHPDQSAHSIGQGFSVKGAGIQRATGSNEKVTNILGHIAMQREAQNTRAEKNSVVKRLVLMAMQNPLKDFWAIDKPPMIKTIDQRTGFVRSGVDPMYKNNPNVVMARIAGKDIAIVFNERNPEAVRLAEALKNLDGQNLDFAERTFGKVTRWIASVNTQYNPIFGLINFARDVQGAMFNLTTTELKDHKAATWKETFRLFKEISKSGFQLDKINAADQALWEDFQNNGGATGYRDMFANPEDRTKALDKELKALDGGPVAKKFMAAAKWLSDYNESMENVVRLAAYKVSLQNGMSKERAASLAKNLTVNFNRKGAKAQKLGAYYAFFNASIQGSTRLAQTLKGPAGRKIIAGGIALGVMQQMLGMMMMGGGDDDEWEKIPDFIKERSIVIPTSKDTYVSIPMPLGFNVIPNIGRLFAEWAMGGSDKPTGKQLAKLVGVIVGGFNPVGGTDLVDAVTPTAADPMIALLRNKDWTGKPIYREDMASLDPTPGFTRTKDSATPWAKGMAYAVNWASGGTDYQPGRFSWTPDQIDYVIGTLTGGAGRELGKLAQTLAAPFSPEELPTHKIPLVGRVVGSTAGVSGQSEKFYENIRTLNGFEREIQGRNEKGEDVDEFLKSEPRAELVGLANDAERQVKQLRKTQKLLKDEGDNAGAKELDASITEVMKGLNMEMRKASR